MTVDACGTAFVLGVIVAGVAFGAAYFGFVLRGKFWR